MFKTNTICTIILNSVPYRPSWVPVFSISSLSPWQGILIQKGYLLMILGLFFFLIFDQTCHWNGFKVIFFPVSSFTGRMECLWITKFFRSILICKYSQALTWKSWFKYNLVPNLSLHLHGQSEAPSSGGKRQGSTAWYVLKFWCYHYCVLG